MKPLKLNLAGSLKTVGKALEKSSPQILAGVGIAGMFSAIIFAVKATPEAVKAIDNEKTEQKISSEDKLAVQDTIKVTWKYYIPTAVTALGSAACIIASNSVHTKRNAAIAAAYTLSETALNEYKDAAIEVVGSKKEEAIHAEAAKNIVDKLDLSDDEYYPTGNGSTRCLDLGNGRGFMSDMESIRHAVNNINERLLYEMHLTLNDFYYELGLPTCNNGDLLGWDVDRDGSRIVISYDSVLDRHGNPVLTIDYDIGPALPYEYM